MPDRTQWPAGEAERLRSEIADDPAAKSSSTVPT
jgi:hypothetical protein